MTSSIIITYLLIRVFHISFSWWSFTGVWVTASLLKSPGRFSIFWLFSTMLLFGWSPLVLQRPSLPVPLNPLVTVPNALKMIDIIITFMFHSFFYSLARSRYLSFFSLSFSFILWSTGFVDLLLGLVFWPRLGDPFVCQDPIIIIIIYDNLLLGSEWQ